MRRVEFIIGGLLALFVGCNSNFQNRNITPELTESIQCYDRLFPFQEGLAKVEKDGKFGYINYHGDEVISCIYDNAEYFVDGLAKVVRDKRYGYININGKEIIPCKYLDISAFVDGLAKVKNEEKKYGYVNQKGKEVIPCQYKFLGAFSNGLAVISNDEGKWFGYINKGCIDSQGEIVVPCQYEQLEEFSDGLAVVCKDGLYGFIDKNGNEIIPCKYISAQSFSEGFAAIEISDSDGIAKGGYIDTKGNEVISCQYNVSNGMGAFSGGIAVVMNEEGLEGCIDREGKEIIPFIYDIIEMNYGFAILQKNNQWGLSDNKGNEIVPCKYDAIYVSQDEAIIVVKNRKSGFINKEGREIIPCIYDSYFDENSDAGWVAGCRPFNEDISIAKLDGKYGAIDRQGKEIIPFVYDAIEDFSKGFTTVVLNGKYGIINKQGNLIVPCIYDQILNFSEGFAVAQIADKWGYIDNTGNSTFSQEDIKIAELRTAKDLEKIKLKEKQGKIRESYTSTFSSNSNYVEEIPAWLQGVWIQSFDSPFGHIAEYKLVIKGNQIIYSKDGQERYNGSFTYSNGKINFGSYSYKINSSQKTIDDGTSFYPFKKVSDGDYTNRNVTFRTSTDVMSYIVGKTYWRN